MDTPELRMAIVATEAQIIAGALEDVRRGETGRALECLERQLDLAVVMLDGLLKEVSSADRQLLVQALRHVRNYRCRHPRQIDINSSMFDKNTLSGIYQLQEQARDVLKRLGDDI
jgi:hypothetical protein